MKVAISNIAWEHDKDRVISKILKSIDCNYIEVAPTKIWPDLMQVTKQQINEYKKFWSDNGVSIVAAQSLLFGKPELLVFGDQETRNQTIEYLKKVLFIISQLGAKIAVFGSPKNRRIPEDMDNNKAINITQEFFTKISDISANEGIYFCIEPNSTLYQCNFITNTTEAIDLVKRVNHPNFRLHLDTGVMSMNGENFNQSIDEGISFLKHFHISEPNLAVVTSNTSINHQTIVEKLNSKNYTGFVSIEMVLKNISNELKQIKESLKFVKTIYQNHSV